MPITPEQFAAMQQRLAPKTRQPIPQDAVEEEVGLHGEIMQWLKANNVPYIHARTDKKSRINPGAPDFCFPFKGKAFFIECKTKTSKRRPDQLAWALLAEMQGFAVKECRSFTEFLEIVSRSD
ncbi:hypothetical protein KGP36_02850 [Patescibacteria group bacterium]|nr:hypothetical protein [Patescibacteria group bacterium]